MTTRDYTAAVHRALLGLAWSGLPDDDPEDLLGLSPRLRLPEVGWDELIDQFLPQGATRLLAEVERVETAGVGPTGRELSGATARLAGEIALRQGLVVRRLAASTPGAAARYVASVDVEGVPDCTVEVTLEPTVDGVWMGVLTRHGPTPAVQVVLAPSAGPPHTLRLAASERSLVFWVEDDPGAAPHLWAGGILS